MAENTAAIRVGRLLEIRVDAGYRSAVGVDELFRAIAVQLARLPPTQKVAVVADWRGCPVMEEKAAERLLEGMAANNARTERSAALASAESSVAVLQFARLIRGSRLPNRRMFMHVPDLIGWLDEILSPIERERLREFLAEG